MDHLTATENLLTAIETVAKSVVDKVEYDKTLTCTVVDVSAAANGKYIVTDGSTKFAAYSENTSFKSGDVVYVTVPNGDMTEQKVILGRKTSDQTEPFNYKSPFDNLLICSPDLINNSGEGVISSVQTNSSFEAIEVALHIVKMEDDEGIFWRIQESSAIGKNTQTNYTVSIIDVDNINAKFGDFYVEDSLDVIQYFYNFDKKTKIFEVGLTNDFKPLDKKYVNYQKSQDIVESDYWYHFIITPKSDINYIGSITEEDCQKYKNFDRIGIKAGFQTVLPAEKIETGDYGLKIDIGYVDTVETTDYEISWEDGYQEDREYYLKDNFNKPCKVRKCKENEYVDYSQNIVDENNYYIYKPNFFYYKNYQLDNSLKPRQEEQYYIFDKDATDGQKYKIVSVYDIENNDLVELKDKKGNNGEVVDKSEWKNYKISTTPLYDNEDNEIYFYKPNTFYWIKDKNDDKQYILSTDNGWDSSNKYFIKIDTENYSSLILDKNNYKPGAYYVLKREEQTFVSTVYLNTQDMIGQPYNFVVPMNQEKVFDISNIQNIKQIDFYLYQDNNFTTLSGEQYQADEDNIFLTNLEMYYGYDIADIDEEYLQIYTTDPLNYYQAYNSIEDICKKIKLKWVHVVDDESYVIDNDHLNYFSLSAAADIESAISNSGDNGIAGLLTLKDESDQYIYTLKLDNSPTYTESRTYLTRSIRFEENNSTQFLAKFVKNYNEEYNENREYYEKKYLKNSEASGLSKDFIKTKGTFNLVTESIQKGSAYNEEYKYYTQQGYHDNNIWKSFSVTPDMLDDNGLFVTDEYQGNTIYQQYYKAETGEYGEYYCLKKNLDKNSISKLYYLDISIVEGDNGGGNIILQLEKAEDINQTNYEQGKYYYLEHKNEQDIDIRWYYYKEGAPAADQYSGVFWKRIPLWEEEEKPALGINYLSNLFELDFYPDPIYNKTEQIKVIAVYNNKPIYSNVLELINDDPVINQPTIEQENALRMRFEDQTNGKYFMYDDSNHLIDKGNSQQVREITLLFDKDDFTSNSVLNNAESIKWIIPKNNTMINIADVNDGTKYEDDRFYYLEDIGKRQEYKLKYTIKNTYSFSNDNNTIVCNVFKDGTLYSCIQNLSFGQAGSNGSEYTFVLNLLSSDQVVTLNKESQDVYYKTFKPLDLENEGITKEREDNLYIYIIDTEGKNCYQQITLDEWDQNTGLYTQTEYINAKNEQGTFVDDYAKGEYYIKTTDENGNDKYVLLNQNTPYPVDKVQAILYDQNYNKVSIPDSASFQWEWISSYNELEDGFEDIDQTLFNSIEETNDIITLQINPNCQKPFEQVCILKVTLKSFGDYDLVSYLPIPIRPDYGPVRYQGPTQVIYSSYGAPNYYTNDIVLYYNNENGELKPYPEQIIEPIFGSTGFYVYQTQRMYESSNYTLKDTTNSFTPFLKEQKQTYDLINIGSKDYASNKYYIKNDQNECVLDDSLEYNKNKKYFIKKKQSIVFKPSDLFINDIGMFAIQYYYNNQCLWSQPILYIQNRYFSSTLNKWDGKLSVDDQQNTILAKSMAAGRKESDNSFSGLIMGDWSETNKIGSANGNFDITKSTGLYAFNHGATSFGLNDNGQMFLGKSGRGRIYFNGENATICSADWYKKGGNGIGNISGEGNGLLLDIDDGFLISRNSDGQYIKIDSLANKNGNEIKEFTGRNDDCDHPDDDDPYYAPDKTPTAGGTQNEYPFVVYGDENNFTAIGWRGNLLLHGTQPDNDGGTISLNASARYLPINVNQHFGVGWNGSLIISSSNIGNVISANYNDFGKGFKVGEEGNKGSSSESVASSMQDSNTYFPSEILQVNDYQGLNWGTEITFARADDNNYDYSELQSNFNGFYATPYGDLYLSRKLIIGDEFSVTGKGYLKASNALFDQCNANTFSLKYTPYFNSSQAQARNEFLRQYYGITEIEEETKKEYSYIPTMGQLGYVTGNDDSSHETDNIGIRSLGNFGIKLSSNKNISITARTTETNLTPFKEWDQYWEEDGSGKPRTFYSESDYNDGGGIYLESQRFGLSAFKTITIGHTRPVKKTNGLNRIQFLSEHELYERGNKILLQVNDAYQQNTSSDTKGLDNENIEQANENQDLGFYSWSEGQNKESLIIEPNAIQLYLGGNSVEEPYKTDDNGTFVKKINGGYEVYDGGRYSVWGYPESEYEYSGNKLQRYKYVSRSSDGGVINDGTARILLGYPVLPDTNIIDHPFTIREIEGKVDTRKKNRIEIYTINPGKQYDTGKKDENDQSIFAPQIANLILLDNCLESGAYDNKAGDLIKIASQNEVLLVASPKLDNENEPQKGSSLGYNYLKLYGQGASNGTADLVAGSKIQIYSGTFNNSIILDNNKNAGTTESVDESGSVLDIESIGRININAAKKVNIKNDLAMFYTDDTDQTEHIKFTAEAKNQHGIYARFA